MSIAQQLEIDKLSKEIQNLRDDKLIEPFVRLMLEDLGIYLANLPYEKWPKEAKTALQNTSHKYPVAAQLYMERLPD